MRLQLGGEADRPTTAERSDRLSQVRLWSRLSLPLALSPFGPHGSDGVGVSVGG